MFTSGSLRLTFLLGLGIGVIGPAFYISLVILHIFRYLGPYSPLWASIESRKRFDCPSF